MGWLLRLFGWFTSFARAWRKQYEQDVDDYQADAAKQTTVDAQAEQQITQSEKHVEEISGETQSKRDSVDARSDHDVLRDIDL
jgi:hypothetical protein